jgi:hypothetical protein
MTMSPLHSVIIGAHSIGCMVADVWVRRYIAQVDDFTVAGRDVGVNPGIASPRRITSASAPTQ